MTTTRWAMVALGVLVVALALVLPGFQVSIVLLGGALAAWAATSRTTP